MVANYGHHKIHNVLSFVFFWLCLVNISDDNGNMMAMIFIVQDVWVFSICLF